jgi:DNA-directed RNA polymerase subunit F
MQRLIRSFNTLTDALKDTLQEQYPDGIDSTHIKTIPTAKGELLRVIELRTAEAMYLIKINPESRAEIDEFLDNDESASDGEDIEESADLETGDDADVEEDDSDDDADDDADVADDADEDDDED